MLGVLSAAQDVGVFPYVTFCPPGLCRPCLLKQPTNKWFAHAARAEAGGSSTAAAAVVSTAAVVATAVNGQRWGLPVDAARVTLVVPDPFEPALDQYEVWAVEWEQVVWLGENAWPEEGRVPSRLFIGHAPAVGPDHVEDYDEVTPGAEV